VPRLAAESARWAPAPRSHREDGVRHGAYPQQEIMTEPIVCENAVLRGTVELADHVFVGPQSTLLGCRVGRCAYLATGVTVLQEADLGAGAVVAIGAAVHARCELPDEFFVPPFNMAIGGRLYAPGDPALPEAIKGIGFAEVAFGVDIEWEDRVRRYEQAAEIRSVQFGEHRHDEPVDHSGWPAG
jgi:hypothetical protein